MNHQLWLDTINLQQQQGKPLSEALTIADAWPFKDVNGHQTAQSRALQADKGQHKPTPFDLTDIEEALL